MVICPKKLPNFSILVWFGLSTLLSGLSASYGAHRPHFDDYEKIKQQAIINSFKAKLVKLLGIDFMPESVFMSNMTNPLPEPIIKDEQHLSRMRSISRKVRNKEIRNYVHAESKETDEQEHSINLNGSIVQQITLLPDKVGNEWCQKLMMDMGPHRTRHHHRRTSFVTLNCMTFDLSKQKEFTEKEIKSADLYIRINLNKHLNYEFASHIYLEVNGVPIKRINLIEVDGDEQGADRYGFVVQEPVFDSADVRKIVKEVLARSKEPLMKVKVLFKNDFINTDVAKLRQIFADLEENMALHVKFGEEKNSKKISKRNIYAGHKKQNSSKNQNVFKDCSELRRSGFKSNNFSCCRESIPISMEEIGWSHFIIEPKVIEYKYCRGSCLCKYFEEIF